MTQDQAIAFIVHVRQTHVEWTLYLDEAANVEDIVDLVGDVAHHAECIKGYDGVLRILRGAT